MEQDTRANVGGRGGESAIELLYTPDAKQLLVAGTETKVDEPQHTSGESGTEAISLEEVIDLGAVDSNFYEKFFFPETARMEPAAFHGELMQLLDSLERYCNLQVFRGGAKTTKVRIYASKRIAYGISRTIVIVGKNQDHAIRSVAWIKKQVEENKLWRETFGLEKGEKWTDSEIHIRNRRAGTATWIVAFGITGSVRGVNFDDYRPDLILIDDVVAEENSLTEEQRDKTMKLIFGALKESLTPATESEFAKMVILQTPQAFEDVSQRAMKDKQFKSVQYGCWTKETEDLPLEQRESSWPARYPSATLREEKRAAIARNELSIFAREMECKLINAELSRFKEDWLQYYGPMEQEPEPDWSEMWVEMAIDPVPPPSPQAIAKGLRGKDYESFAVVGRKGGKYYLLETSMNRGHEPSWTIAEFFRLANKWRPKKTLIETVAYQRTLEWLLRQAMKEQGRYWVMEGFDDKRQKYHRIVDGLSGVSSNKQLFIHRERHVEFCSQFVAYPNVPHDDVIEAVAVALTSLSKGGMPGGREDYDVRAMEEHIPELEYKRGAP